MTNVQSSTDRIEKTIRLRAPRARVWRALTDFEEFGHWFGVKFHEPFKLGALHRGTITGTKVNHAEAVKEQQPYVGMPFEITIERLDAERVFAFRWHPGADQGVDVSSEPMTLVTFVLEDDDHGTLLTVTESGFDRIPLSRRAKAFSDNEQGWTTMMSVIATYLTHAS
jgi:uncharacterized protein YndB with AHSA1/START domain